MVTKSAISATPPEHIGEDAGVIWAEVVGRGLLARSVTEEMLETYCVLVINWRDAAARIAEDGLVVKSEKRGAIVHPAVEAERRYAKELRDWAPLVNRAAALSRRPGTMVTATKAAIDAVPELKEVRFKAAVEAAETTAWAIDEAQRRGPDEFERAIVQIMPGYLKWCSALRITPASLPADAGTTKGKTVGKLHSLQEQAAKSRPQLAG